MKALTRLPERNLDILRSIAVLLVVFNHVAATLGFHTRFVFWTGQAGVQAFFVHTSLVLMASLERDGAPERSSWVPRFYLRRAFRIYPLAWVIVGIVVLFHVKAGFTTKETEFTPSLVLVNLAMIQDITGRDYVLPVLWSLPLEIEMYVLLPLCFVVARGRSAAPMIAMLVAGCALAALSTYGIHEPHRIPSMWRFPVLRFIPCFLMGVLAYWMLRRRVVPRLPSWTWIPIVLGDVWILSYGFALYPNWGMRALFCVVIGVGIPCVVETAPSMLTRAAHTIATYSYGIYLIHQLALRVGFGVFTGQMVAVQLLISAAVLTVGCYAAYHLVEKPCIDFGRRLLGERGRVASLEATAPPP